MSNRIFARTVITSLLALLGLTCGCGGRSPTGPSPATATAAFPVTFVSISPNTGSTGGNTPVTIIGTGFHAGATVTLDGGAANVVILTCPRSPSTPSDCMMITATSPAHAAGTVDVVVTNPDGQSGRMTGAYTYAAFAPPSVTAVLPSTGSTGGSTSLTITGTGFEAGATVTLDGIVVPRPVFIPNSTTIGITTPAHAAGPVDVVVTNPSGERVRFPAGYTYTSPGSFDFNGSWNGTAYPDDYGTEIRFTIQDNMLTSVSWLASPSCDTSGSFALSPQPLVSNGAFSFVGNHGVGISGTLVSDSHARGTINIAPCPATTWSATKR